jgi:hypothetical protein
MVYILIIFIIILIIYFLVNRFLTKEKFCNGNVYCNGNKDSALCIGQYCKDCGLQAKCTKDSDCIPNNCIDGCCDNR